MASPQEAEVFAVFSDGASAQSILVWLVLNFTWASAPNAYHNGNIESFRGAGILVQTTKDNIRCGRRGELSDVQ